VTGVEGTLAGGLRIASIEVEQDVAAVRVRDLKLRIDTLPLLWQTVEVRGFDVAELRIEQRERDQPPPERAPRFLPGMLTVWTEQARIRRIVIQPLGGDEVELRDLEASGTLYGKVARIRKAAVKLHDLQVEAQGLITSDLPLDLEGTATATYSPAQGPRWVIDGRIDGDLDSAVVEGGVREPFRADLEDGEFRALSPWHLKGRAKVSQLDLAEFGAGDGTFEPGHLESPGDRISARAHSSSSRSRNEESSPHPSRGSSAGADSIRFVPIPRAGTNTKGSPRTPRPVFVTSPRSSSIARASRTSLRCSSCRSSRSRSFAGAPSATIPASTSSASAATRCPRSPAETSPRVPSAT
jgi:hypothetical protein